MLTKDQLLRRGWQSDSSYIFYWRLKTIDHLFVQCSIAKVIWEWIITFNNFHFVCQTLDNLWIIDCCMPLKDKLLVELIRNAVCWVLWLVRNKYIFDKASIPSLRSLGLQIIHLSTFWCTARKTSQLPKLTLMLP
jgi:hypothetical protein